MKEEDLSAIKRYSIVEYLERKGIKPVRRTPAYALCRSPLRAVTHPSFKVDTEAVNSFIGNYVKEVDFGKRPLSKMMHDVATELGLI